MTVNQLRTVLDIGPTPLMARLVTELGKVYGSQVPLFVCSACKCVTADSRAHSH